MRCASIADGAGGLRNGRKSRQRQYSQLTLVNAAASRRDVYNIEPLSLLDVARDAVALGMEPRAAHASNSYEEAKIPLCETDAEDQSARKGTERLRYRIQTEKLGEPKQYGEFLWLRYKFMWHG